MPPHPSTVAFFLAAALLAASPAPGQDVETQEPASESLAGQLDRLNHTLGQIAALLERQLEGQRLELALRRVELSSNQVETLESELARARSERTNLEDELANLRSHLDSLAVQVEQSHPASVSELEVVSREVEERLKVGENRIREQEMHIFDLEKELTKRRQGLEALEDELDRHLEGF